MKTRTERLSVLLVEDYEDNRLMMKHLLELSGYRVLEATNGVQAIKVAMREIPDLILMDLSLPQVDGLSATRQIRAVPALSDVPIVAVSAHDSADFHAEALASGCNEYVTKPIDFGQLETVIKSLLEQE
jgi:CheY-like chemotaxis protein